MYNFEILSEYYLPQDLIVDNSDQFIEVFKSTLKEKDIRVRVASLKAVSCFLSSIEDIEVILKY
jgi:hypothetical protein